MLDSSFTSEQLQPLFELCVTIRLKSLSKIIENMSQGEQTSELLFLSPFVFYSVHNLGNNVW